MYRILILLCFLSAPGAAEKVLVIESYHAGFGWDIGYRAGLESMLKPQHEIVFFEMDTKRRPAREHQQRAELAYQFYLEQKPDLVVLGDDNALSYMLPKLHLEPVPIVFLGINSNPRHLLAQYPSKAGVTGVLERPFYSKTMAGIGESLDSVNTSPKVLVMFDSSNTSKIAVRTIIEQASLIKRNLNIDTYIQTYSTQHGWYQAVETAKDNDYTAIVIGLYQALIDSNGQNAQEVDVLKWTNENSPVPIFGFWDFSIGNGRAAGGVVLYGFSQGKQAGGLVNQVFNNGKDASQVPIEVGDAGMEIYSKTEFERWGLKPPSGWLLVE